MPARRFATPLFCGIIALASAEFSGNALAQTPSSDGEHARDICGAPSCSWTGLADVVSTGSLRLAPFGWRANVLFASDDASEKSNDGNLDDATGRGKAGIAAGLGIVGAAAIVVATSSSSPDRTGRVAAASTSPAIGTPIRAATLSDAVTTTPEPATVALIATGLLLFVPLARAIRSR